MARLLSRLLIRTQISLTDEQMRWARAEARRRDVSIAGLVREALDRLAADTGQPAVRERAKAAVGGFRSGRPDTSARHDDALAEADDW